MLEIFQFPDLHKEDLIMSWVDPFIIIAYNSRIKDKSVKETKITPRKILKAENFYSFREKVAEYEYLIQKKKKKSPSYGNSTFKAEENLMTRYYPTFIVSTFEHKNKHQPNEILEFSDTFIPTTSFRLSVPYNVYLICIRKQTEWKTLANQ